MPRSVNVAGELWSAETQSIAKSVLIITCEEAKCDRFDVVRWSHNGYSEVRLEAMGGNNFIISPLRRNKSSIMVSCEVINVWSLLDKCLRRSFFYQVRNNIPNINRCGKYGKPHRIIISRNSNRVNNFQLYFYLLISHTNILFVIHRLLFLIRNEDVHEKEVLHL